MFREVRFREAGASEEPFPQRPGERETRERHLIHLLNIKTVALGKTDTLAQRRGVRQQGERAKPGNGRLLSFSIAKSQTL
jgi:hypothetical protein